LDPIGKIMDKVQKLNTCSNVPSSQTFRSYEHRVPWNFQLGIRSHCSYKLCGFSRQVNYTDRATATCRWS
jgi:hypothetical protein